MLDAIDRQILAALQADASLSHQALAERVGASPTSCWRRIRALEEAGILRKRVALVDGARVDLGVSVLCGIRLKSHSPAARRDIERLVATRPEILEGYAMSGEIDYMLRIVVRDVSAYEQFLTGWLLDNPHIASASSSFALRQIKYETALPV
ncbi:MAG: Lrp/AsnC family transcriptional regulator [Alphaproteobacteria bacterium]|nr:Lrp/AsnC family transcriptional regulator [Alphaproteobacteria bacterium]